MRQPIDDRLAWSCISAPLAYNPRLGRARHCAYYHRRRLCLADDEQYFGRPEGAGFGSLAGVALLFSVPELLLAGWIHYLAFDLFVGAWEVKDAQQAGIHHVAVIPCLFATLIFGPGGLVLYWIIKLTYRVIHQMQASEA